MGERIKKWCLQNKTVLTLIVLSFAAHLLASIFLFSKFHDGILYFENEDAYSYVSVAQNVASGHGFSRDNMPSAVRTPGLPLLYALLIKLPGSFTWWVIIVQNILATLTGVVIYYLGKNNFSARAGLIAGYLAPLEPYMLMTANLATTETLFNFVLVVSMYFFIDWFKNSSYRSLAISALGLSLLILIRPVALYLPPVLLILYFFLQSFKKIPVKKIVQSLGLWAIIIAAVIAPWSIRQYVWFGSARVTNIDAYMVYFKIAPLVIADQNNIGYNDATKILDTKLQQAFPNFDPLVLTNTFEYNSKMFVFAKQIIFSKPSVVFKFYALSLIPTLTGTGYEYMLEDIFGLTRMANRSSYSGLIATRDWSQLFKALFRFDIFQIALFGGIFFWVVIYAFIIWAFAHKVWWQKYGLTTFVLLVFLAYFAFFALGPASHARYRMPTIPLWFLLLGASLDFLAERCKIKRISLKND